MNAKNSKPTSVLLPLYATILKDPIFVAVSKDTREMERIVQTLTNVPRMTPVQLMKCVSIRLVIIRAVAPLDTEGRQGVVKISTNVQLPRRISVTQMRFAPTAKDHIAAAVKMDIREMGKTAQTSTNAQTPKQTSVIPTLSAPILTGRMSVAVSVDSKAMEETAQLSSQAAPHPAVLTRIARIKMSDLSVFVKLVSKETGTNA